MEKSKYVYLLKNTLLFTISSFGSKLITFLLVPLYTNILSTNDYGIADMVTTSTTLLIYVFTINIADSVLRFAIERKERQDEILSYGVKVFFIGSAVFGICVLLAWKYILVDWPKYCYIFLFLNFLVLAFNQIIQNYLRALDMLKEVAIAGVLTTLVIVISNIICLLFLELGLIGYFISTVVGSLISSIYCIICAASHKCFNLTARCDNSTKNEMKRYSIPLIFNGVCWWINSSLDKYFIIFFISVSASGVYAVSSKIPTILTIFQTIFSQAWNLSAIKEFDKKDEDGFFAKAYNVYNVCLILICSGLILMNIPLAKMLFAKDFFEAWQCSSILLVSIVFSSLSGFLGSIFSAVKNSRIFAISTIISAVVNTILNIVMIPIWGAVGAAIATAISFAAIWIIRYICAKKYIDFKINLPRDIFAYLLLFLQIVFERMNNHCYIGQIGVLIILMIMYFKDVKSFAGTFISKLLRRVK